MKLREKTSIVSLSDVITLRPFSGTVAAFETSYICSTLKKTLYASYTACTVI